MFNLLTKINNNENLSIDDYEKYLNFTSFEKSKINNALQTKGRYSDFIDNLIDVSKMQNEKEFNEAFRKELGLDPEPEDGNEEEKEFIDEFKKNLIG